MTTPCFTPIQNFSTQILILDHGPCHILWTVSISEFTPGNGIDKHMICENRMLLGQALLIEVLLMDNHTLAHRQRTNRDTSRTLNWNVRMPNLKKINKDVRNGKGVTRLSSLKLDVKKK